MAQPANGVAAKPANARTAGEHRAGPGLAGGARVAAVVTYRVARSAIAEAAARRRWTRAARSARPAKPFGRPGVATARLAHSATRHKRPPRRPCGADRHAEPGAIGITARRPAIARLRRRVVHVHPAPGRVHVVERVALGRPADAVRHGDPRQHPPHGEIRIQPVQRRARVSPRSDMVPAQSRPRASRRRCSPRLRRAPAPPAPRAAGPRRRGIHEGEPVSPDRARAAARARHRAAHRLAGGEREVRAAGRAAVHEAAIDVHPDQLAALRVQTGPSPSSRARRPPRGGGAPRGAPRPPGAAGRSLRGPAAIDEQAGPSNESRGVGGQEDHAGRDVLDAAEPPERDPLQHLGPEAVVR